MGLFDFADLRLSALAEDQYALRDHATSTPQPVRDRYLSRGGGEIAMSAGQPPYEALRAASGELPQVLPLLGRTGMRHGRCLSG